MTLAVNIVSNYKSKIITAVNCICIKLLVLTLSFSHLLEDKIISFITIFILSCDRTEIDLTNRRFMFEHQSLIKT